MTGISANCQPNVPGAYLELRQRRARLATEAAVGAVLRHHVAEVEQGLLHLEPLSVEDLACRVRPIERLEQGEADRWPPAIFAGRGLDARLLLQMPATRHGLSAWSKSTLESSECIRDITPWELPAKRLGPTDQEGQAAQRIVFVEPRKRWIEPLGAQDLA